MPRDEPAGVARMAPARAAAGRGAVLGAPLVAIARVEAQAGHDHEGVARVRVDGDPLALARARPAHEAAGVHPRVDQVGTVQAVRDGAGAVVGRVLEARVATAIAVVLL